MELPLDKVTSSEVAKRFGFYYDEAMTHPIAVERNGAARVVMLSAAEYERLARLDHVALSPDELSNEALRAILTAEPAQESYDNNKLLD
ncbi:MAG: type II toxin-antitoxin system Phd/YefM family antitoxin [Novosphingobium sp.]